MSRFLSKEAREFVERAERNYEKNKKLEKNKKNDVVKISTTLAHLSDEKLHSQLILQIKKGTPQALEDIISIFDENNPSFDILDKVDKHGYSLLYHSAFSESLGILNLLLTRITLNVEGYRKAKYTALFVAYRMDWCEGVKRLLESVGYTQEIRNQILKKASKRGFAGVCKTCTDSIIRSF